MTLPVPTPAATPSSGAVGLLLAAGRGSRFDPSGQQSKLLATLPNGSALALAAAQHLLLACPRVLAILPQHAGPPRDQHIAQLIGLLVDAGCEIVFCADSDAGLGHSLAAGVNAAPDATAWLVTLADMPNIAPATIATVLAACDHPQAIAVPCYQRQRGHPVAFGSAHLSALRALHGDYGARTLLQTHTVTEVICDDPGILRDVDTAQDLQQFFA